MRTGQQPHTNLDEQSSSGHEHVLRPRGLQSLTYALNGEQRAWIDVSDANSEGDRPGLPAEPGAACEAAGHLEPGKPDAGIWRARVLCFGRTCLRFQQLASHSAPGRWIWLICTAVDYAMRRPD